MPFLRHAPRRLYIAGLPLKAVLTVDVATGVVIHRTALHGVGYQLLLDPARRRLYAITGPPELWGKKLGGEDCLQLEIIDPVATAQRSRVGVALPWLDSTTWGANCGCLYALTETGTVLVVDPLRDIVAARVSGGWSAEDDGALDGLLFDDANDRLLVCSNESIYAFDAKTLTLDWHLPGGWAVPSMWPPGGGPAARVYCGMPLGRGSSTDPVIGILESGPVRQERAGRR
jgi:hypothetical protein